MLFRTKTPRNERLCLFCRKCIGGENHVMMECNHDILKNIRNYYIFNNSSNRPNGLYLIMVKFSMGTKFASVVMNTFWHAVNMPLYVM